MTWRYERGAGTDRLDRRAFALARFARVVPLYWLSLGLTLVAYWLTDFSIALSPPPLTTTSLYAGFAMNFLGVQSWVPSETVQQYWNAPGWSISNELFFYACFPYLLRLKCLSGSCRSFFAVFASFSAVLGAVLGLALATGAASLLDLAYLFRLPVHGLLPFVLGILLCRRLLHRKSSASNNGLQFFLLLFTLVAVSWALHMWRLNRSDLDRFLAAWMVSHFVYVPLFTWLVGVAAVSRGWWCDFLSSRVMVLFGNASYALYLLHWLVLGFLVKSLKGFVLPSCALLAVVATLVLASVLVYELFEAPLRSGLYKSLSGRSRV